MISKALLYHYFPSKQAYFVATLGQDAAEDLAERVRPDVGSVTARAARQRPSTNGSAGWRSNRETTGKLLLAAGGIPEVRELDRGWARGRRSR